MKKFAVIIPAYRPQHQLIQYVAKLVQQGADKVVVVDDGSGPAYGDIFQSIHHLSSAVVLSYPHNQGKGYALKIAMAYLLRAEKTIEAIVTADADGQHLVQDVVQMARFTLSHSFDYVLGMRNFYSENVPGRSFLGNVLTARLFYFLFGRFYSDTQTGLRAFKRSELRELLEIPGYRFDYEMNMLVYMTVHSKRIARYDIQTVYQLDHSSHYKTVKDSLRIAKNLFSLHWQWMKYLVDKNYHDKKNTLYGPLFKLTRAVGQRALPRYDYSINSQLEAHSAKVFVSHHQNMLGPVSIMLWLSQDLDIRLWALDVFSNQQKCYQHYVDFTFSKRFAWPKALSKCLAWPLSYYVAALFHSAAAIAVFRESRDIIQTMKESTKALAEGQSILIFPDIDYSSDQAHTGAIYQGFLHLDKYFYRQYGQHTRFIPLFADEETKEIRFGSAIAFDPNIAFIEQREDIAEQIQDELNRLADKN